MGGILTPWSVPREWPGGTAFILGGGPSLRNFDSSVLAGRHAICVNNSWELLPTADVLYFCDSSWWNRKTPKDPALSGYPNNGAAVKACFRGRYIASISDVRDSAVKHLRNAGKTGLSLRPDGLCHGTNSGYQAMNLAVLFGVSRIVLLGFDMHTDGEATHWHAGHGRPAAEVDHKLSKVFVPNFQKLVEPLAMAGVQVLNATPGSALTYWPHVPLAEILGSQRETVAA